MGDEIVNFHMTLVDSRTFRGGAAGSKGKGEGGGGDAPEALGTTEDLNNIVSAIR
jgi:hypothetical protein